jgi:nitrate reductase gamma subunit
LIVLESVGLTATIVALVSLLLTSVRYLGRHRSSFDIIAATLILLQLVSGLTIAVRYRWASSWAEVTLTPYLHSLLGFRPSIVLVARMPFVVQLHVFCAFAILAIVPMGLMASPLIASVQEFALASAPVVRFRPRWRTVTAWTPVEVPVSAEIQSDENRQP